MHIVAFTYALWNCDAMSMNVDTDRLTLLTRPSLVEVEDVEEVGDGGDGEAKGVLWGVRVRRRDRPLAGGDGEIVEENAREERGMGLRGSSSLSIRILSVLKDGYRALGRQ